MIKNITKLFDYAKSTPDGRRLFTGHRAVKDFKELYPCGFLIRVKYFIIRKIRNNPDTIKNNVKHPLGSSIRWE
jgi:hypothetical protein